MREEKLFILIPNTHGTCLYKNIYLESTSFFAVGVGWGWGRVRQFDHRTIKSRTEISLPTQQLTSISKINEDRWKQNKEKRVAVLVTFAIWWGGVGSGVEHKKGSMRRVNRMIKNA